MLALAACSAPKHGDPMARAILRGSLLGIWLAISVACGGQATNRSVAGSGGSNASSSSNTTGGSNAGSTTGSTNAGSSSNASGSSNTSGSANASGGRQSEGTAGTGGGEPPAACDCGSKSCPTPAAEVAEFCSHAGSMDLATYTEREGCDFTIVRVDYEHGDRTYLYDHQGALVGRVADNAFAGGYSICGMTDCAGTILRQCRLCRGSYFKNDNVPDCPADLLQ